MTTEIKTYDPAVVSVIVGGLNITGFAPGAMIELAPDDPQWRDDYGVDGESARWRNLNPFDTLTLNMMQSSNGNLILSNLLNADIASQAGILPVLITDDNTSGIKSTYLSTRGWIAGPPRIGFAGSPTARSWALRLLSTFQHTQGIDGTPANAL